MESETQQSYDTLHPGFIYTEPEGKEEIEIDYSLAPVEGETVEDELEWHMDNLAYKEVTLAEGGWDKDSVLDAIQKGHADAFTINRFRFPPTFDGVRITEHFPMMFDDREFGERIANRTLQGFNRIPRS